MFDKIQMILMMKMSISNNRILRLNKGTRDSEIVYRNYKYFNYQNFNDELKFVFSKENVDFCSKFN